MLQPSGPEKGDSGERGGHGKKKVGKIGGGEKEGISSLTEASKVSKSKLNWKLGV